jgi:hypothetical protein
MSPRTFLSILFFALVALVATACGTSDSPVAPETFEAGYLSARGGNAGGGSTGGATSTAEQFDTLYALKWAARVKQDVSASAEIGNAGGEIKIPELGFKITFPQGAVSRKTTITATVMAGTEVAYRFEPHGITFKEPVKIMQDLRLTTADDAVLAGLKRGYWVDPWASTLLESNTGKVQVKEVQDAEVETMSATGRHAKFYVTHFSGYLLASGRTSRDGN